MIQVPYIWLRSIGKSGFRFWNPESNAKSENGFHLREIRSQGGFQFRNPNPDFMDFLFTIRLGNPERDLRNYSRERRSSFCKLCVRVQETAVLKDSFSFPNRTVKRKSKKKKTSQRLNPLLDFAFDYKSEIRILKSKSRFPIERTLCVPEQWNDGHFGVPNHSCGRWTFCHLKLSFGPINLYSWSPRDWKVFVPLGEPPSEIWRGFASNQGTANLRKDYCYCKMS